MLSFTELGLSVVAGSLTTLSPCVFPLLPLVLGGAVQRHRAAPLAMGGGMALSFALLGMVLGSIGSAVGLNPENVRNGAAIMLIAFGLVMLVPAFDRRLNALIAPLASGANQASTSLDQGSLKGAFLLGGLLGLIWSPCSGPLLGSALTLVATDGGAAHGALVLGLFGVGAAIPLVAAAYLSRAGFARIRQWVVAHGSQSKKFFGVVLFLVGVAILTGVDRWIEIQINDVLPDAWLALTMRF
nr:cytochrome c biogenesis CcdA family protein [Rhodoferax sp.]